MCQYPGHSGFFLCQRHGRNSTSAHVWLLQHVLQDIFLLWLQCWSAKFCLIGYCLCLLRQRYMPVVQRLYFCRKMTIYPMFIKNESQITFSILRHMLILTLNHLGCIYCNLQVIVLNVQ